MLDGTSIVPCPLDMFPLVLLDSWHVDRRQAGRIRPRRSVGYDGAYRQCVVAASRRRRRPSSSSSIARAAAGGVQAVLLAGTLVSAAVRDAQRALLAILGAVAARVSDDGRVATHLSSMAHGAGNARPRVVSSCHGLGHKGLHFSVGCTWWTRKKV